MIFRYMVTMTVLMLVWLLGTQSLADSYGQHPSIQKEIYEIILTVGHRRLLNPGLYQHNRCALNVGGWIEAIEQELTPAQRQMFRLDDVRVLHLSAGYGDSLLYLR